MLFDSRGLFGALIGRFVAGASSVGLIIGSIFTVIGVGSLTIVFDSTASHGTKIFGAAFGGSFALVGSLVALGTIAAAIGSWRSRSVPFRGGVGAAPAGGIGDSLDTVAKLADLHE